MSFLKSPGTQGQNMRSTSKSSMNTVLFVNATIGFSVNFSLVLIALIDTRRLWVLIPNFF